MFKQAGLLPLFIKENRTTAENDRLTAWYRELTPEAVLQAATEKKVLPFVANTLCALGLDTAFWQATLEQYRRRNQRIIAMLDRVYATLSRHGVLRMFVTENVGALLSAGGDIALFASGDVDNCADISEREKIYAAFDELGFERRERFALRNQIAATFHPHDTEIGDSFYISVDFHPLARLKLPCFVNADDFVDWDALYCYGDTAIRLAPPDALMYICMLHISLHSFSRAPDARLYFDLINTAKLPVDYEKLSVWAKRDGTRTRMAVSAAIAHRLFAVPLPMDTLYYTRADRVLRLVYDDSQNDLIYEPHGLKVLQLELLCNDGGVLKGLGEIVFPDKAWMRLTYGSAGLTAHIKHVLRIL